MLVSKVISDDEMLKHEGKNFDESHYTKIIRGNRDIECYWNDNGVKKILFKIKRNAVPKNMADYIYNFFVTKVNVNKSGKEAFISKGQNTKTKSDYNKIYSFRSSRSKITGFYDKSTYKDISKFGTTNVCRKTAFTRDHFEQWKSTIPFFELIGKCYKKMAPSHYKRQLELFNQCPEGFQIGNTPFTTVTSNYNWRTSCHKDKGDFSQGMGNLTILGGDFGGCYLGFPQFKIAVDVRPGDIAIMDVHQWHCNTELECNDKDKVRLSFVTYFREKMTSCNAKKVIDGETYYYRSKTSTSQSITNPKKPQEVHV